MKTYVSVLSVATGAIVTPEKHTQRRKKDIKSLAMYPQRKDPIPNQYINMLGTEKCQIPPPQLARFRPGYKSLRNQAEDYCNDSTDTSRTNKEDYVENLKAINNKNIDYKYKEKISQHQHSIKSIINRTKE